MLVRKAPKDPVKVMKRNSRHLAELHVKGSRTGNDHGVVDTLSELALVSDGKWHWTGNENKTRKKW